MAVNRIASALLLALTLAGSLASFSTAEAKHYHNRHYSRHDYGRHYGHAHNQYYDDRRGGGLDYKTGKILKGGLVGAGIGAGAGLLLDRPVGKTALVGAGIGAGTQAVRYSRTIRRHPVVKTAAYGALAGTGVSAATGRKLSSGALWGGGIGAGLGVLRDF